MSQSETTDATYRIQFDPVEEFEYFGYLAPGEEVLLAPSEEADEDMEAVDEEAAADDGSDAEMEASDAGDHDDGEPEAKRQKLEETEI